MKGRVCLCCLQAGGVGIPFMLPRWVGAVKWGQGRLGLCRGLDGSTPRQRQHTDCVQY
eukprot:XP_001698792.1 predicted protein [Chlamydomonas reinhardtii]